MKIAREALNAKRAIDLFVRLRLERVYLIASAPALAHWPSCVL